MAEQPPYQPGYPEQQNLSQEQIETLEEPEPVIVQPAPPPPPPKPARLRAPGEESNIVDGIWSCGAGCIQYSIEDVLKVPKRREKFVSCIVGSLVAQFFFIWLLIFLMQGPNWFGEDFEIQKTKILDKIYDEQDKAGNHLMNQTGSSIELWKGIPFVPLALYFVIIIAIFRCCNCGRKSPVNWMFAILAYLCLLATLILLLFTVPYLHYMLAGGLGSLIVLLICVMTCVDILQNAWIGYVVALVASIVTGSISLTWYYLGGYAFFSEGNNLEQSKHLVRDMGAVPAVVIMFYSILMPQDCFINSDYNVLIVELIAAWCIEALTARTKHSAKRHIRCGSVQTLGHLEATSRTGRGDRSDSAILRRNFRSDTDMNI